MKNIHCCERFLFFCHPPLSLLYDSNPNTTRELQWNPQTEPATTATVAQSPIYPTNPASATLTAIRSAAAPTIEARAKQTSPTMYVKATAYVRTTKLSTARTRT